MEIKTTAFIPVFEEKLKTLKRHLKNELSLAKSDRRKDVMKSFIKETKSLQKLINECNPEKEQFCCPHCGVEIEEFHKNVIKTS